LRPFIIAWNTTWNPLGCNVTCDNGTETFTRNCLGSGGIEVPFNRCIEALPTEGTELKHEVCYTGVSCLGINHI